MCSGKVKLQDGFSNLHCIQLHIFPSKLQLLHHAASLELKNGQAKKVYLVAHRHVNVALERRKGPDSRTLCARSGRRSKNEKEKKLSFY